MLAVSYQSRFGFLPVMKCVTISTGYYALSVNVGYACVLSTLTALQIKLDNVALAARCVYPELAFDYLLRIFC